MSVARMIRMRTDLVRYARSLGAAADAEDLAQTAFVRGCERAEKIAAMGDEELRAYLFRTVRNAWIDQIRKRTPEVVAPDPQEGGSIYDDVSGLYVEELLDTLPPSMRECVRWRYIDGENSAQIARRLNIPAATVRTRLRAAVLLLRRNQTIDREE